MLKNGSALLGALAITRQLWAKEYNYGFETESPIVRLGSNENPWGPSPAAQQAMARAVATSNRYPWDVTDKLREGIAKHHGVSKAHIVMGAGSSEILGLVSALAAAKPGNAITPNPTFGIWMPAAEKLGLTVKKIPLSAGRAIDLTAIAAAVDSNTRMVYLCNPNNPTGTVLNYAALTSFVTSLPPQVIVLSDEAYTEYTDTITSLLPLIEKMPNLVIAKTFSKIYGLAGARCGYAVAQPATAQKIADLQPWANASVSAVTLAGALASLEDKTFADQCKKANMDAKGIFIDTLERLSIPYIPSHTSFVYFDGLAFKGDMKQVLAANNIQGIRQYEAGTQWMRLSMGTPDEMRKVAKVLGG